MSQLNRTRVNNVLKRMAEAGVEQMIVTSPISIFYLTGEMVHPGERCLALYLNTDGNVTLVVNQLHNYIKLDGAKVVFFHDTEDPVAILAKEVKPGKLGVDKEWLSLIHILWAITSSTGLTWAKSWATKLRRSSTSTGSAPTMKATSSGRALATTCAC